MRDNTNIWGLIFGLSNPMNSSDTCKQPLSRSSIVELLDRPLRTPPLAKLLSTKSSTPRQANSSLNSHLTANQMVSHQVASCSNLKSLGPTRSWMTKLRLVDSSRITAPIPATAPFQDLSEKIGTALVSKEAGMVLGWTDSRKVMTSLHQRSSRDWLSFPCHVKILKQAYFEKLPAE